MRLTPRPIAFIFAGFLLLLPLQGRAQSGEANVVFTQIAFSPDGSRMATSTGTGELLIWDADAWTVVQRHVPDAGQLFGFAFHPVENILSFGSKTGRVFVLDLSSERIVMERQDRDGTVSMTALTRDGRLFASGEGRSIHAYRWQDDERIQTYDTGEDSIVEHFLVLDGRDQLFVARFDSKALLLDLETGAPVHDWRNKRRGRDGNRNVKDVAVRPGTASGYFTGVGGDLIAVDLDTGRRRDSLSVHPDFASDLRHSLDGELLAVNDLDGNTTLIETDSFTVTRTLTQEAGFASRRLLFAVAFRPGTRQVVTGGIRLPLIVWDTTTGERLQEITSLPDDTPAARPGR